MSTILSRWPVVITCTLGDDEVDADGHLTRAAVRRIGDQALEALAQMAPRLAATERRARPTSAQMNGPFVGSAAVTVGASATEIFPESILVTVRVRPTDGSPSTMDAAWMIAVEGGVPSAVRDELIALAHAARHML